MIDEDFVRDVLGVEIYDNEELKNRIDSPGKFLKENIIFYIKFIIIICLFRYCYWNGLDLSWRKGIGN